MALSTNPTLVSLVFLVLIFCSFESKAEDEYTYHEGTTKGPENWGHMNPQWKVCGDGKFQSPIDLRNKRVQEFPQLGKLDTDYKPASAVLKNRGHDIMLLWRGDAGKFYINETDYKLVQCHWHTPSEHTLDGSKFDMELHAVHVNCKGQIAVIGLWYKIGKPDPFLSKLLPHIKSIGDKEKDVGKINPSHIKYGRGKYYRYIGSLTTPPCTEGVIWTIVKKVRTVSIEQLMALKKAVHHGYEANARPTQKLDGRPVWLYAEKRSEVSEQNVKGAELV